MAAAGGVLVTYKTQSGHVPAIAEVFLDASGDPIDAAYSAATVEAADLLVLGVDPVRLTNVGKELTVGTEGAVALADRDSVGVGKWYVLA